MRFCLGLQPNKIYKKKKSIVKIILVFNLQFKINSGKIGLHGPHRLIGITQNKINHNLIYNLIGGGMFTTYIIRKQNIQKALPDFIIRQTEPYPAYLGVIGFYGQVTCLEQQRQRVRIH